MSYERPSLRFAWLNRVIDLLPPIAPSDEDISQIKPIRPEKRHYVMACISVSTALAMFGIIAWLAAPLRYSVISAMGKGVEAITHSKFITTEFVIVLTYTMIGLLIWQLTKHPGALRGAAMGEEKMFRLGAENWNRRQRLTSNVIFGSLHLINLYVPLAGIFALSTAGWWFMSAYRRAYRKYGTRTAALQESSAMHAAHNTTLLCSLPFIAIGFIIYLLFIR